MSDYNVVATGWSPISRFEYIITTFRVPQVGIVMGNMVTRLLKLQLTTVDQVHLIGHSLGSHVVGTAGGFVRDSGYGKVARVTGLDPARPGYEQVRPKDVRLDDDDGQFVDIIHTSAGVLGYREPLGHADFYPNGGYNNQPGCTLSLNIFCSHERSYEFFAESIYREDAFPAVQCDSYANFQDNKCNDGQVVYMGNPTPSSARGVFYMS
ncbi:pancreatic triacylglycerol lipase, partial [Halyomorpha halys]|uniref:pancreatic triacylglycerol lipase n=1 Tax=Halyomorpha halys TaxID=286706 RepID=UPI0034D18082